MAGEKKYRTDHLDPFVKRLETIRERLKYSQKRMAGELGVPFRTYQKWVYFGQHPRHREAILTRADSMLSPRRTNCWEILNCRRGPGEELDLTEESCPATTDIKAEGINNGVKGGRICWAISGTFCGTRASGSEASKLISCFSCEFFTKVLQEEGLANFKLLKPGQTYTQR